MLMKLTPVHKTISRTGKNFLKKNLRVLSGQTTECVRDLDKLNKVKLGYGSLDLGSSQFSLLPQKNYARFKSGQNNLKLIILVH